MRILSIDPGSVSGAWGYHRTAPGPGVSIILEADCDDIPPVGKSLDVLNLLAVIDRLKPDVAVVERAVAFSQGVTSAFNYGAAFGAIVGILQARGVPVELIYPSVWKGRMGLDAEGETSREKARLLYPALHSKLERKKDHNRAEALLLGRYFFTAALQRKPGSKSSKAGSSASSTPEISSRSRRSASDAPV